jgi:pyruvate/2-oxoglutarate dehydrogenase complex dihydrolipoamide dehydrogenase (E3) component/uncharacterized membrane protein YdjX (TVP38/TMEM64 family)
MEKKYPFIVIGAGAAGLTTSVGLAKAGKKVLLIEKGTWGGDCTNFGCIPSKALIAAAKEARFFDNKKQKGIDALVRVREIVSKVRGEEGPEQLEKIGIETITGNASFLTSHCISVANDKNEVLFQGKSIVIATGSSPKIPTIKGLNQTPFLTNETIFNLKHIPDSLCVLGGGPIGSELAQAFARFGAKVYIVQHSSRLLKKEEKEAADVIRKCFEKEGIELYFGVYPSEISYSENFYTIKLPEKTIQATHLLVATGRSPNVKGLNLENAGVEYSESGIPVDAYGRTSQKHIWAIGDIMGQEIFTHFAENRARTAFLSLILPVSLKFDKKQAIPRVTYTDPEVASFGMQENQAIEELGEGSVKALTVPFSQNDRAITAGREEGFVKVVTEKNSSKILGATIVGPRAGEMLPELSLAAYCGIPLKKIGKLIHPYPTYNLAIRKAADLWMKEVFLPKLKKPLSFIPWKRYLPIALIAVLMMILYATGAYQYLSFNELNKRHQELKGFVGSYPFSAPLLFIGVYIVATAASLPGGAFLSLIGGFLFPIPFSTLYVVIGATIGASFLFLAARTAIGDSLKKKAGPLLRKMGAGFQHNAWSYLLFLRLVPIFPFWLVNLAPALFGVSFITYLWTTFVGIIPGAYVFTQAGAGLSMIFESEDSLSLTTIFNTQIKIALVALGIFALMPILLKKIFNRKG